MNRQRWIAAVGVAFTSKALFYGILNFIPLLNILHLLSNLERCELRNAFKWIGSYEKIDLREKQLHGYEKLQKSLREGQCFHFTVFTEAVHITTSKVDFRFTGDTEVGRIKTSNM